MWQQNFVWIIDDLLSTRPSKITITQNSTKALEVLIQRSNCEHIWSSKSVIAMPAKGRVYHGDMPSAGIVIITELAIYSKVSIDAFGFLIKFRRSNAIFLNGLWDLSRSFCASEIQLIGPWESWIKFQISNFQTNFSDWWLKFLLWNCSHITRPHWWWVSIGSGNGLLPSGKTPLHESMLTQIYVAIWRHKDLTAVTVTCGIRRRISPVRRLFFFLRFNQTSKTSSKLYNTGFAQWIHQWPV